MKRIAINGFGRIGRCVFRALADGPLADKLQVVAINEPAPIATMAHLLRYDSTHGPWHCGVEVSDSHLLINGQTIAVSHHENLSDISWPNVDVVLECTGHFDQRDDAAIHLQRGAARVLFSQPAQNEMDATVVYGLNEASLLAEHTVASAASCTTNAVAPVIDCLHKAFGVESGVITTIHSAMNDQPLIDAYHHTDLRKTRSAIRSIIPVDTGLAKGIDRILPEVAGRFEAQAMRVPTVDVSAIDLTLVVNTRVSADEVNDLLQQQAKQAYRNVLGVSYEPLASCDYLGEVRSGVVDASQTRVAGENLVKVLIWFDNEWGYANRVLDVANYWLHSNERN